MSKLQGANDRCVVCGNKFHDSEHRNHCPNSAYASATYDDSISELYSVMAQQIDYDPSETFIRSTTDDPFSEITVEDEYVVYDFDGISISDVHKSQPYITFDISMSRIPVVDTLMTNVGCRRVITNHDDDRISITVGNELWYGTVVEYDLGYTYHPEEQPLVEGEIRVFNVEEAE